MADHSKIPQGFKITPLQGKAAILPDWQNVASCDPGQIETWAKRFPGCNWGVVRSAGYWMLDVDDVDWFLQNCPDPVKTFVVRTGSGKFHYYFKGKMPEGLRPVRNPKFKSKEETPEEKPHFVEFPLQCVAPGSVHPETGREYEVFRESPLAELPKSWLEWLMSLAVSKPSDPKLRMGRMKAGWDPRVELPKAGLRYELKEEGGLFRFDYHVSHGKCLVAGAAHESPQNKSNNRTCSFFWNPKDGQFWHSCFAAKCQVPGQTKIALAALGLELSSLQRRLAAPPLVILSNAGLTAREFARREPLLSTHRGCPVFHVPSLNEIHAWRGTGKTAFGIGLAAALASGGEFLAWKSPRPFRVLYVEGELPGAELQERSRALAPDSPNLNWITPEAQPDSFIPLLSSPDGRELIEEAAVSSGSQVLFLDSISSLANIATNEEEEWLAISDWFKRLRNKHGLAVFYMHHDGKNGTQRGHSKIEDLLDKAVHLSSEKPGCEGLSCSLKFDKARQPVKEDSRLDIQLVEEQGRLVWAWSAPKQRSSADPRSSEILAAIARGEQKAAIAKRLGITIRTLNRILEKQKQVEQQDLF